MVTKIVRACVVAMAILPFALSCAAGSKTQGELEPRYVAVHNTLAAMGLVQVGPIHQSALAEGRDARFAVELPPQCVTVVAIGAPGVRDLDLTLLDADDKPLARDVTKDPQATVRACPDKGGRFSVVVKMTRGAGDFAVATWIGGVFAGASAPAATSSSTTALSGAGTCDSPIPLAAGSTAGNTRKGDAEQVGSCGSSESRELVYKLDVTKQQRVTIEVDPTFDSVLYVRKDDCAEKEAEIACNDDVSTGSKTSRSTRGSRIDEVLDPGTYFVFVDGYNSDVGSFRMSTTIADVPSLAEDCQKARPILQKTTGSLSNAYDHAHGSCDQGKGPDMIHRLDVPQRARVRVLLHSDEFAPIVHLRRTCTDDRSEVGCTDSGLRVEDAAFVGTLDPGAYYVFADSGDKAARGQYTIDAELTTEQGAGVRGDSCGDALPISITDTKKIEGDTFDAKDDLHGKCSASGAPDVVYRFDVPKRSRVIGKIGEEEGDHVFVLMRSCTDTTSEIACGPTFDEVLAPGTYWLAVDGAAKGPIGRFTFQLKTKDILGQEGACRTPPSIALGQTVTGTTANAGDRFTESCAGREDSQASADRVYKLTLAQRTHLQLLLSTPNHDGVLAIRKSCIDPPQMKSVRALEVGCNNDGPDNRHSKIDTTLDAGTYYVVVDGHQAKNEGTYTLEAKVVK